MTTAVLDLKQGSPDWLLWRAKGIGSSDAAAIVGRNPWMDRKQLWELKTGRGEPQPTNDRMFRGNDLEPIARKAYETLRGDEFPAVCMVHPDYPFLKASADGRNLEFYPPLVEFKCPNARTHQIAVDGFIPDHYKVQLDHLLLVSGDSGIDYVSYDGHDIAVVEHTRDEDELDWLLEQEVAFWGYVTNDIEPPNWEDM